MVFSLCTICPSVYTDMIEKINELVDTSKTCTLPEEDQSQILLDASVTAANILGYAYKIKHDDKGTYILVAHQYMIENYNIEGF